MITEMLPANFDKRTIYAFDRLQKFICVHHNGETYVTWAKDKDAARQDCIERSREGEPWKVLAYPAWM